MLTYRTMRVVWGVWLTEWSDGRFAVTVLGRVIWGGMI